MWLTVLEALHLVTGRPTYRAVFEFWLKIFGCRKEEAVTAIVLPHRAVLAVMLLLMATPAALAAPPGRYTGPQHPTPAITGPCCNPPDPGAGFLSSAPSSYW